MSNKANLKSITEYPAEVQREMRSKGGHASVAARRQKKFMRQTIKDGLLQILTEPISTGSKTSKQDAILAKVMQRLFNAPNMKDLKILCEILGELKSDSLLQGGLNLNINTTEDGKKAVLQLLGLDK